MAPEPFLFGDVSTIAAFDARDGSTQQFVTWKEWVSVLKRVAGYLFWPGVTVVPNESYGITLDHQPVWHQYKRNGEYALELSRVFDVNTCGARLVNCDDGTVLQYEPEVSSNVTVYFGDTSVSMSLPVMTDAVAANDVGEEVTTEHADTWLLSTFGDSGAEPPEAPHLPLKATRSVRVFPPAWESETLDPAKLAFIFAEDPSRRV
jgi:hypothetical protein